VFCASMAEGFLFSGDGGRGSGKQGCLSCSWCSGESQSGRGGPGEVLGDEATRSLGVPVGGAHASFGMSWTSRARSSLVVVGLLSDNGWPRLVK
jgi:hypothetical protein